MSKKSQKRRGPRPARKVATPPVETTAGRPAPSRRAIVVGASLGAVVGVLVVFLVLAPRPTHSGGPTSSEVAGASASASPPPSASAPAGASAASSPSVAYASPSVAPGGKVAEALVAVLHADPFIAHIDESILASSLTGATRLTLTANAVGDVSGRDVSIHSTGTGGGPPTDTQIVSVGDVSWTRAKGAATWDVHPRSATASSLDGLLKTIRLIDDPKQLADLGVETIDGQALHHLTAAGAVAYRSLTGVDGSYDTFDVWVTDAGIPVDMKATFSESDGLNSIIGSTEIRYSKVGGPITISPPAGAPTLAPSAEAPSSSAP